MPSVLLGTSARLTVVVAGAAALSLLLLPGVPTYDPFAWIIWGREILHGALTTTNGPSWKPLPVLFTTPFALFGDAAPWLWLIVARAGAIGALVAVWRLTRRLGGGTVGAVFSVAALAAAPWWVKHAGLGNSEGLTVLCAAAAFERMVAGEHRAALWWAIGAALLRPESWPLLLLYGLWLVWRRRQPRPLVIVLGVVVIALWTLPEWWGSGDPLRALHRARTDIQGTAPTHADHPFVAVLGDSLRMLTIPVVAGLALLAAALPWRLRRWRRGVHGLTRGPYVLVPVACAWLAIVGWMTSGGFSGNQRYLIVPVALLIVCAGAAFGRAAARLPLRRRWPAIVLAVAAAAAGAAPSLHRLPAVGDQLSYQQRLTAAIPAAVRAAGGREAIGACGAIGTGPYLVPQIAWNLREHIDRIEDDTVVRGTVFQVRTTVRGRWVPVAADGLSAPLYEDGMWRVRQRCEGR